MAFFKLLFLLFRFAFAVFVGTVLMTSFDVVLVRTALLVRTAVRVRAVAVEEQVVERVDERVNLVRRLANDDHARSVENVQNCRILFSVRSERKSNSFSDTGYSFVFTFVMVTYGEKRFEAKLENKKESRT